MSNAPTAKFNRRLEATGRWPQHRFDAANTGTNGDATGVPKEGSLCWRRPKAEQPVVDGDRMYTFERHDDRLFVTERRVDTGKIERKHGVERGGWTALANDDVLYSLYDRIASVDPKTWTQNWSTPVAKGYPATPIVDGSTAYVAVEPLSDTDTTDGVVTAIDLKTGETRWTNTVSPSKGYRSSGALRRDGLLCYVDGTHLVAVDPENGDIDWNYALQSTVSTDPVVAGKFVLYADQRSIRCLHADDGTEAWTRKTKSPNGIAVTDDVAFVSDDEGLSALGLEDGQQVWRAPLGNCMTPSVDTETVYVDGDAELFALERSTGKERWSYDFPDVVIEGDIATSGSRHPPILLDDGILVPAVDGLYAFGR